MTKVLLAGGPRDKETHEIADDLLFECENNGRPLLLTEPVDQSKLLSFQTLNTAEQMCKILRYRYVGDRNNWPIFRYDE